MPLIKQIGAYEFRFGSRGEATAATYSYLARRRKG